MRKKIVAGNWKMNTLKDSAIQLSSDVNKLIKESHIEDIDVVLFPPFPFIPFVLDNVDNNRIGVGAQNCATEEKGAYTGEVSAQMIKSLGANYVIIGHSERRAYYGETDEILNEKLLQALKSDLIPVFCIGEKLEERQAGNHFNIVKSQLENTVFNLSKEDFSKIIIAYEPVWAIGTGQTATPEQAQEIHSYIRSLVEGIFGIDVADDLTILYGGSCKPSNAKELFTQKDIDGGLIGGASLKAEDFVEIITSF